MSPRQVGLLSVAVTLVVPPSSEISADDRCIVTVGPGSSSSMMKKRRVDTVGSPEVFIISALPVVTVMVTSIFLKPISSASLFVAEIWTRPVLVVSPAANVSTVLVLISKLSARANAERLGEAGAAETLTVTTP